MHRLDEAACYHIYVLVHFFYFTSQPTRNLDFECSSTGPVTLRRGAHESERLASALLMVVDHRN